VNISEMDVRVSKLDTSEEIKTLAQAQIYHDIIAAALTEQAFDGIWLWGFSDRHVSFEQYEYLFFSIFLSIMSFFQYAQVVMPFSPSLRLG
jgi:hypothetical protein